MPENKTQPTRGSVTAFLKKISNPQVRDDCFAIVEIMKSVSKLEPIMWGSSIIGFGIYHYVSDSGREGDWMMIGFSPRKQNISIYLMGGLKKVEDQLPKLGKYKIGGGCLYIKSLSNVNRAVLKNILAKAYKEMQKKQK